MSWFHLNKKNIFILIVIVIFSVPAILSLLHSGFFQSDDGEWMVIRFSAFHQALRDGQFPVRFLTRLNYGYGYPVANFLYPGFMYLGEIFKLLGFGFVGTIKIILGLSMLGSAIFTFLWLAKLFSKWASFVGSLLYLYAPYHLFDLYKRGSVGEILALSFVPFVLWQIEKRSFVWVSLGIAFLVLSHNTLSVLFLLLIILYLLVRGLAFSVYFFPSIILGLALSAFFWVPAISDLQYTDFQKTQISEWQNYFASFGLAGIISFFILTWFLIKRNFKNQTAVLLFLIGSACLFLSFSVSSFVWKFLPVSFVQFPFRLLSVVILTTSFLAAFLLDRIKRKNSFLLGIIILIISFVSAFPYIAPKAFFDKEDLYYSTNEATTTVKNEYMPIWINNNVTEHAQKKVTFIYGQIKNLKMKSNRISFSTNSQIASRAIINTVYFPGWKVNIDKKNVPINYQNKGLIDFEVPKGQHEIVVSFSETPIRLGSDIISLLGVFMLLFIGVKSLRKSLSV